MSARFDRVRRFWETLAPESLPAIAEVYAGDVHFRDPFNDFRGREPLREILSGMFDKLESPTFKVLQVIEQGADAVLVWHFDFRARGEAWRIHGVSRVKLDETGRVAVHHDYWDAAGELYAKLPLIGPVVRWLGRRFAG